MIDARVIKLGKLFVPKTKKFYLYNNNDEMANTNNYYSTGYFNYISVLNTNDITRDCSYSSSLKKAHEVICEKNKVPNSDECSYQYVKVFTNVNNFKSTIMRYDNKKIDSFWEKEDLLLFLTMIHIGNNNVTKVVEHIEKRLVNCESEYLIYLTFDYSDIIIFFKSNKLANYFELIYSLDFDTNLLIEDSYTIYGYNAKKYKELYDKYCNKSFAEIESCLNEYCSTSEEISVSIHLGLETQNHIKELYDSINIDENIKISKMYGRHDICIDYNYANTKWLLFTMMKIDFFSDVADSNYANGIILYETFIKSIINSKQLTDETIQRDPQKEKFYDLSSEYFSYELSKIFDLIQSKELKKYETPIHEIKNSILSIIKNNFAEEFILSMLESFMMFILYFQHMLQSDYSPSNLKQLSDDVDDVKDLFANSYFESLNCLVSTVMHTDRQFIQATAFNAVFYDVPPKIVAYYMALIYQFQEIMRDIDSNQYVFIFTPNVTTGITLSSLTDFDIPPTDRLISISIEENAMYDTESVFRRLAHETAHFAGENIRCRLLRQRLLVSCFLGEMFQELMPQEITNFDEELYRCINRIVDELYNKQLISETYIYSCQFDEFIRGICQALYDNGSQIENDDDDANIREIVKSNLNRYFIDEMNNNSEIIKNAIGNFGDSSVLKKNKHKIKRNNKETDIILSLSNYLCHSFFENYEEKLVKSYNNNIYDKIEEIIDVFKETYSDLQAIIILNLSFEEYLKCFIEVEGLDYTKIEKRFTDISRITIISKIMFDVRLWHNFKTSDKRLNAFRDIILNAIGSIKALSEDESAKEIINAVINIIQDSDWLILNKKEKIKTSKPNDILSKSYYSIWNIYLYLLNCLKVSIDSYNISEKHDGIINIRAQFDHFKTFNNIELIMEKINETTNNYKEYLLKKLESRHN